MEVYGMKVDIQIVLARMKYKNPALVNIPKTLEKTVDPEERLATLKLRKKLPLIYHKMVTTRAYVTINVQLKVDDPITTRIVILARHGKLITLV
jgi:hypothetical protein